MGEEEEEKNFPIGLDDEKKIKIKPELMVEEKLYPFIYEGSVFLFFKDNSEIINCYEVQDEEIKGKILKNPSKALVFLEDIYNEKQSNT